MKKMAIITLLTVFSVSVLAQIGGATGTNTGIGTGTPTGSTTENPSMRDEDKYGSSGSAGVGNDATKPRRSKDWRANRNRTQDETTPNSRNGSGTNNGSPTETNPSSGM